MTKTGLLARLTIVSLQLAACDTNEPLPNNCESEVFIGIGFQIGGEFTERKNTYNASLDETFFVCQVDADCVSVEPRIVCPEGSEFHFCPINLAKSKVEEYEAGLPALGDGLCGCISSQMVMASCVANESKCVEGTCSNLYL